MLLHNFHTFRELLLKELIVRIKEERGRKRETEEKEREGERESEGERRERKGKCQHSFSLEQSRKTFNWDLKLRPSLFNPIRFAPKLLFQFYTEKKTLSKVKNQNKLLVFQ